MEVPAHTSVLFLFCFAVLLVALAQQARCEKFIDKNGYLKWNLVLGSNVLVGAETRLEFTFRYCNNKGVLIYQQGEGRNFFALGVNDQRLYIEASIDGLAVEMYVGENVLRNQTHDVTISNLRTLNANTGVIIDGIAYTPEMPTDVVVDLDFSRSILVGETLIGGYESIDQLRLNTQRLKAYPIVCIDFVRAGQTDIDLNDPSSQLGVSDKCVVCLPPSRVTLTKTTSYLEIRVDNTPRSNTIISINFRTKAPDGLLFYFGGPAYLALYMEGGALVLRLNTRGSGADTKYKTTRTTFNDGEMQEVSVTRTGNMATLVDGAGNIIAQVTFGGSQNSGQVLNADRLYVGGFPDANSADLSSDIEVRQSSRGCLEELRFASYSAVEEAPTIINFENQNEASRDVDFSACLESTSCQSYSCTGEGQQCSLGVCECIHGYAVQAQDPLECYNIDDCTPNPCQNGAVCTDKIADYNCTCTDRCKESSWSASSQINNQHSADRADINTRETAENAGAWAARTNDTNQWLMRDLGKVKVVTGIITKGRNYSPDWPHRPHDQYVTSYVISYGIENGDEQFYTNATNETIVFTGNQDRDTEVFNDFLAYSGSIEARFVKIHPRTWHEHISMRAKVVTFDVNCEMGEFGHLSFPGADGGAFSYSDERCNSSSANGKPLASRFCRIVAVRGALWDKPVNLTCDINLQNLSQVEVNNESALSVVTDLQVLTTQADTISSNDVTIISTIVQDIVNASATEEIGDSLLTTVDNLINVSVTSLQQSQQETRGPTRVVQALETFADTVVLTTEKYTAVRSRVALQAADISPEELDKGQGFAFISGGNDSNSLTEGNVLSFTSKDESDFQQTADISILLPANISNMIQISDSSEVRLSYTLYNSSSLFVQTSQDAVGTRIIGGRIAGRRVQNLPEQVIITFTPLQDYAKEGRCVFWDFKAEAGQGAWSTEGCESTGEENGRYKCACNHLTNFAVLFNVHGGVFGDHEKPLEVITAVGCVVSIVCLILTLLSFVLTRKSKRGSRTGRHAKNQRLVLINLCVALLAILVIFLIGVNRTASPIGCTAVAALLHYFLLAALLWMAVEAVSIYRAVVLVFDHHVSGNFVIKAAAVAWGFPLVATVSTAGPSSLYQYRMEKFCWLAQEPLIYAFLLPAGLILLFNLLVFVIVMCKLVRNEQGRKQLTAPGDKTDEADRSWITRQIRRAFSIMALFGLTWVFGFLVISDASPVFAYLFCIFNTLQGLFIFVFHCAMREDMAKWWQKINCINGKSKRGRYQLAKGDTPFSPAAETPETIALSNV